jgi:hypothetical protein
MNIIDEARAFMEKARDMTQEALGDAVKLLPKGVRDAYWKMRKAAYFAPENEKPESRKEILSLSGRYKLVISRFATGPGRWDYAQGKVFRRDVDEPIAVVQRNYGSFPHLFVEDHNGHDYLVCGEDYQGQTVIELDSGARRDLMSDGSDRGFGFCWSSYKFDAATKLLVVCGCHWACPYEFRFFDFSRPMDGWPMLETDECIGNDEKAPVIEGETIRCFGTREPDDDEEDTDEEAAKKPDQPVDVVTTYRRKGLKLVLVEEWVSDYEKDRRQKREEAEKKYEAWLADFKASDPLYLAYAKLVEDPALTPESYMSMGQTYEGWCPDFQWRERRFCRRIITHKERKGLTVDLEWAVDAGPIKLIVYRDGKRMEEKFWTHSAVAMAEAFAYAKSLSR